MARRTNGSAGKPSASKIPSRAASAGNVLHFPSPKHRELRALAQSLVDSLAGLAKEPPGWMVAGDLSDAELEYLIFDLQGALATLQALAN